MYSIPPGGFRHPYPALAMNASMSRWVSAGMRDPPWVSQSWQWVFGHLLEADAGLSPAAAAAVGAPGGTLLCMGTVQSQGFVVASSAKNTPRRVRMVPMGGEEVKSRRVREWLKLGPCYCPAQAGAGSSVKPDPQLG